MNYGSVFFFLFTQEISRVYNSIVNWRNYRTKFEDLKITAEQLQAFGVSTKENFSRLAKSNLEFYDKAMT